MADQNVIVANDDAIIEVELCDDEPRQHETTPNDFKYTGHDERGFCEKFLIFLSYFFLVITFPFSLCFMFVYVQV